MPEINGPIMYPIGWTGFIGKQFVTITEIHLSCGNFKKAMPAKQIA